MSFKLRVPTDGTGTSAADIATSFLDGSINIINAQLTPYPVEFEISPSNGVLMPLSEIEIQVSLCFPKNLFSFHSTLIK